LGPALKGLKVFLVVDFPGYLNNGNIGFVNSANDTECGWLSV
jgi:hypothetical protein